MILRNKNTGEIKEIPDNGFLCLFDSLDELTSEYEDYYEND